MLHIFKSGVFSERVTGSTPFHPLVSYLQKRHFHREGYRLHPFSSSCFISLKTAFSPRGLPAPPLFILLFHIFKNDIFTERVTGSKSFHPLVSYLQKRHLHREGYRLHPFSSSCLISSSKTTFTLRFTGSTRFHPLVTLLQQRHFHRDGYGPHPFSSSCFISSKTAFSPRGLPAPPLFILLFHIFKNDIFTESVTSSTPFHPFVSYLQKRHFHRDGYRLHPFSSSCFISSKRTFSLRGLPAPPLFILLFHIFKNDVFTERIPAPPLFILLFYLQRQDFHREGYGPHPFSSSCFISSKTTFSPRGLPAPPLFILLFHIFKKGIFTERVTGSKSFHPLVSYLQNRHLHREGYRLHPFSSSCFISSQTTFSPRGLPAPPLFILLYHIFINGIFTERVTGPTPFRPLVSLLQKRHFHRDGYRLHPFSSSCFISSTTSKNGIFTERGYRLHPFSSSCFISSKTIKNGIFTERVTGSTPFRPLVSYLQKRRFHREGYRLHPFSSPKFIFSKTAFSPRGLPAPPLFILLFYIFKSGIFTERVTGSISFHPLVSYLQKRHFLGDGYRLHPISSSCFISSKTAFSPRGLRAPPLFILLFHFFKNIQKRIFTESGYRLHPFSSSCFIKTAFSPRGSPAPPLFILLFHIFKHGIFTERVTGFLLLFHIFKNGIFTERVTSSTPFHPLVSFLQIRHFHREGYRLHPFSSSFFISSKRTFSLRGLPAPPLFILLFHILKDGIFTFFHRDGYRLHPFLSLSPKMAFSPRGLPVPPLLILLQVSFLQQPHFHREGYRLHPFNLLFHIFKNDVFREGYRRHPFSSSCFISSNTAFSPRWLPAPPLFLLLFDFLKNGSFTERVTGSTPFHPLNSFFQKRHFHREGYQLQPLFILFFQIFKSGIFSETVTGSTPLRPLVSYFKNIQKRHFH